MLPLRSWMPDNLLIERTPKFYLRFGFTRTKIQPRCHRVPKEEDLAPFARCLLFPNDSESDKHAPRKGQRDCWFITENVATGRSHVLLHLTCCLLATRILPLPSAAHKFSLPVFRSVYRVPSPWQSVTDQARHLRLHVVRARLTSIGSGPRRDGRG